MNIEISLFIYQLTNSKVSKMAISKQTPSTLDTMKVAIARKRKATPKKSPGTMKAETTTKPDYDTPEYRKTLLDDASSNPVGFRPKDIKGLNIDADLNILENFGGHRKIIYLNDGSLEAAYASSLITDKLKSIRVAESGDIGNYVTTVGSLITHDVVKTGILKDCLIYAPKSHGSLEFQEASLTALLAGNDVMMFAVIPEDEENAVDDYLSGSNRVMGAFENKQFGSAGLGPSPFGNPGSGFGSRNSFGQQNHIEYPHLGRETIQLIPGRGKTNYYLSVFKTLLSYYSTLTTSPLPFDNFSIHHRESNNDEYEAILIALKTGVFSNKVFITHDDPNLKLWVVASNNLRSRGYPVALFIPC